ncbi:hypothetical protein H8356DRAFT_1361221 [Neocallimastix lanati (nom. inval.)]|nr:hypothetical protein H8356DRAFT_1361221 [Neocallimastix sp. JGI-2020a]
MKCVFNENGDIKLCIDGHCGRFMNVQKDIKEIDTELNLEFFWYSRIFDYNCVHCILYARYNSNTKASNTKSYKQFTDCYNRNEHTSMRFVPNNRDNPDDCDIKGYVNIKTTEVVIASYNQPIEFNQVHSNSKTNVEMALTEYGCCTIVKDDKDTKWIENLPHHIQIN